MSTQLTHTANYAHRAEQRRRAARRRFIRFARRSR
jgi:hypothetical protein